MHMSSSRRGFRYDELEIEISPDVPGKYRVRASSEDAGERTGIMELPVPTTDLPAFLRSMAKAVLPKPSAGGMARDGALESVTSEMWRESPREFGVRLYHALFRDEILLALVETTKAVESRPDRGLRIRLSFDTSRADMPQVLAMPWELLAKSVEDTPLTVSRRFPLVRALNVGKSARAVEFERQFTVLVLMASPRGVGTLDLAKEEANLRKEWAGQPNIDAHFRRATRAELRRSLRELDPYVIHFMGHGDFRNGRGVLLFETDDENRDVDAVDGEELGITLQDEPRLRLVFLNACKTAATGLTSGSDPFAGVATALVRGGVTAVLAMQFPITDNAAIQFSNTFYECLVEGEPVDAAVGEARKVLHSREHAEWATPVLFMRSRDGDLFRRTDTRISVTATNPVAPRAVQGPATVPTESGVASVIVQAPVADVANDFTVFLATTSDRMRPWERRALRELPTHGITVVTAEPTPLAEHEAAIRALAGSADLFVHLLGDLPGEIVEGAPDSRTYAMEQFRIGHQCARSQLVFLPTGLSSAALADPDYRAFLQELENRPRRASRLEVITTDVDALVREIVRKRDELQQAPPPPALQVVYLDMHYKDDAAAADVKQFFTSRGITWMAMPAGDNPPREMVAMYEQAVKNVPLVLVVAGAVDDGWVTQRVKAALKAGLDREPPTEVAVLRLRGRASLPRMPQNLTVIGDGTTLEESRLDALLAAIAHADA